MRAASIFRLLAAQAFPQFDDLRAQSLAPKLTFETDHFVARLAGAQAREPLLVTLAGLVLRHRQWRSLYRGIAFRPLRLGLSLGALRLGLGRLRGFALGAFPFRGNAFPQPDDLGTQSLAAKLTLKTDHLVSR